ncbi:MAG: hypothetical protein WDN28_04110 [Chthoniobacter sp.]
MQFDPFQSPAGIALFVVCLYCTVAFLISWCGWRQLAGHYAAESKPAGTTFRNASGWITPFGSYSRCLNVVVFATGIHVETQLMFRLFHRPLSFPWRCVSAIEPRAGIFSSYTRVTISAGYFDFRLRLPQRAAAELQRLASKRKRLRNREISRSIGEFGQRITQSTRIKSFPFVPFE